MVIISACKVILRTASVVVVMLGVSVVVHNALATVGESGSGWAWGGTTDTSGAYQGMGWISFNDTNAGSGGGAYGVSIPVGDGPLSGYAWSEYYGWVSFSGGDLNGCSPVLAPATRVGNMLTGGARILSIRDAVATGNAGGFDGCISLSGSGYGVTVAGPVLSGYAWSSDLGWIDMSGVIVAASPSACADGNDNDADTFVDIADPGCDDANDTNETDAPVVTLSACDAGGTNCSGASRTITLGTTLTLEWSSTNAETCGAIGVTDLSTGGALSGTDDVTPTTNTVYQIACEGPGGIAADNVTIFVAPTAPSLEASAHMVQTGSAVDLLWDTNNGDESLCTITGPGVSGNPITNGTGDAESGTYGVTIQGRSTYTLSCPSGTDSVTIEVIPTFWES